MSGSGISWDICKSAPHSRQIPRQHPTAQFFTGRMPFLPPNQQHQSTEGTNDKQCMKNNSMPSLKGNAARQSQCNGNGSRPVSESLQVRLSARGRRPWFPSLWAESGRRFCCRDRRSLEHTADRSPSPAASTLRMHTHTHAGTTERFYRQSCQTGFFKNLCRRNVVGCVKRLIVAIKWFKIYSGYSCWMLQTSCVYFIFQPAAAAAIPLPSKNPTISCLIQIQTGFTFLVLAYPGCPGKQAVKRVQ